jgi:hypothetical protein
MNEHEAIERETVRLLVEALKREHGRCFSEQDGGNCPVCLLIKKCEK